MNKRKMDDSGYGSPPKCSREGEKTHFFLKIKLKNRSAPQIVELIARKDVAVACLIKQKFPKIEINKLLLWARIRGHVGYKCINPYFLQCGLIEPETEVECEYYNGRIYDYEIQLDDTKTCSKLYGDLTNSSCKLFFISIGITDRRSKKGIIHVQSRRLGRDVYICVVANPGETFKEALTKDGRFENVERLILKRKIQGKEAEVDMNYKPSDYEEDVLLEVEVKAAQSTNKGGCTVNASETSKKLKKTELNKLAERLWGKDVVYDFSKDISELTTEEMRNEMEQCLRARAWCSLVGPNNRAGSKYERSLEALAKTEFANQHIKARTVSFNKEMCNFYDSVGFIECGDIHATCFLVSSYMIVTNWHVVNLIEKARNSSTRVDYSEVFVHFDYEDDRRKTPLSNGYKLLPFDFPLNVISHELDYAFLALEHWDEEKLPDVDALGEYVTRRVPHQGNMCIVGHPFGNEKQEELCPILPQHEDRRSLELERRLAENEHRCQNRPSDCALTDSRRKCVHFYSPNIRKLYGDRATLTYDVGSMFEGSSGAPVFDMNCKIVALHTQGFRVGASSIVEVGVTFEAIIANLEANGHSDFVREHFPYCWNEDNDGNDDENVDDGEDDGDDGDDDGDDDQDEDMVMETED